jgi:hypothetical protein
MGKKQNIKQPIIIDGVKLGGVEPSVKDVTVSDYSPVLTTLSPDNTFGESKYDLEKPWSVEEIQSGDYELYRGKAQNGFAQLGLGLLRATGKALLEGVKTPGYLYALGDAMRPGVTLDQALDNSFIKAFEGVEESMKEAMPVYQSYKSGRGGLVDNLFSTSFWGSEGADGVGYMAGLFIPGAGIKALGMAGKIAKLSRGTKILGGAEKIGEMAELGTITLVNTIAEAGAEAKGLADNLKIQFRDRLNPDSPNYNPINPSTGQVWTEKEISEAIADNTRNLFTENFALLVGPNLLMNKFLLGRFAKDKKILDSFRDANGNLISNPVVKRKLLSEYGKKIGLGLGSEGFFEEGSQFALENYHNKKAFNETNKNLLDGFINEYYNGLSNIDGQKSIALGAILGGFGGAIGQYRQNKAESKMRPKISKLIDMNFDGFAADTDIYDRDENGNIIKVNVEKQLAYFANMASEMKASQLADAATLADDPVLHDLIQSDQFARFAVPFIQLGDVGLEILDEKIDKASETRELRDNELLGQDKTKFKLDFNEQQWKQNLKNSAKQLAAAYNGSIELANKLPFLEEAAAKNPKYAADYINVLANMMYFETSKQMFYVEQISKLNAQILDIDNSDKRFLPQNEAFREKFVKQIESLEKLLSESKENYKILFDENEQSKAYDEYIKDRKEEENLAQQAQAEVDAVNNEFDPVNNPQGAAKEQAAAASNVAEDLKNEFGNTQTNPPTLNEILNQSQGDRAPAPTLSDVLNQTAQQTPVSTDAKKADIEKNYFIVTMSGSRTIEQLKSEKNPDFIGDYEFLDLGDGLVAWKTPKDPKSTIQQYLIADTKSNSKLIHKTSKDVKGNFARINEPNVKADAKSSNDNYELRLNRLNEAISKINNAELAALEGSKPAEPIATQTPVTSTVSDEDQDEVSKQINNVSVYSHTDDYDNVDKIPLNSIEGKIKQLWNDFRMLLFKGKKIGKQYLFDRNENGLPNYENKSGIDVTALNNLRKGDTVRFESRPLSVDPDAIAILDLNNKLIGWVRASAKKQLEQLKTNNQLNTEQAQTLQQFEEWRTTLLNKLKSGEEVYSTVQEKGTGNLYTKTILLPTGQQIVDANIDIFNSFREKDTIQSKPIFVYASKKDVTGRSKLVLPETTFTPEENAAIQNRLETLNKYDLKPGRVFKLIKDLNDEWSLMPLYANNITDDIFKDIVEILKNTDNESDIQILSRDLNKYIYSTTNDNKSAPLLIKKNQINQIVFYLGTKSFTLDDIKSKPEIWKQVKDILKKQKQNIEVANLNQSFQQQEYAKNKTLLTNVNLYEGEYFIQPYVSYVTDFKININPKPVTTTPAAASAQPSTNQQQVDRAERLKRAAARYKNPDTEGAASVRPDYSKYNEKQFKAFLKKKLPQLSIANQDQLNALRGLLIDPVGYFKGNLIYLFKGAGNLTAYHEAFHGVFRNLLTVAERENIINEAKSKYKEPTKEDLDNLQKRLNNNYTTEQLTYLYYEEQLADDFAIYTNDKNNRSLLKRITDAIRAIFDKILSYFDLFESANTSSINDVFDAVNEGRFKQRQSISNNVVNLPLFQEGAYSPKAKLNIGLADRIKVVSSLADNFLALLNQRIVNDKYADVSKKDLFNGIYDELYNQLNEAFDLSDSDLLGNVILNYADLINQDVKTNLKERGVLDNFDYEFINSEERNPESKSTLTNDDKLTLAVSETEETQIKEGKDSKGYREQTSISGLTTASARIKLFLSAIPVYEENENGELVYEKNELGLQKYHDFKSLYYYIEKNLIDKYTFEEQLAVLKNLTSSNPALISVLNKLQVNPPYMSAERFEMLQNDFKTNFSKQQLVYTLVKHSYNPANNTISFKIIDANRNNLPTKLKESWKNSYTVNVSEKGLSQPIKLENTLKKEIKKLDNENGALDVDVISSLLKTIHIDLSKKTIEANADSKVFARDINVVLSWYIKNNNTNYDAATRIAIENLIKLETAVMIEMHSQSFIDGEGNNIWTIQLPSELSKFLAKVKNPQKRERFINDFFKDVFYKNSNLLNELQRNSKFAEIFSISYLDSFKDEIGVKKGIGFTSLSPRDYLAMKIALFNNLEVNSEDRFTMPVNKYLYIVPADKSMQAIVDSTSFDVFFAPNNIEVSTNSKIIESFYNIFLQEAKRINKFNKIKNSFLTEGSQSKFKPTLLNEYGVFSKKTYQSDLVQNLLNKYNTEGTLTNEEYAQLANKMDGQAFKFNYLNNDYFTFAKNLPQQTKELIKNTLENSLLTDDMLEKSLAAQKNIIKKELASFVYKTYEITLKEWESKGIITKNKNNEYVNSLVQLPSVKTTTSVDQRIKNLALKYSANYLLHNIELSNMFNGDVSQYKPNDLQKRTNQSQSFMTDGKFNNPVIRTKVNKDVIHDYSLESDYTNMVDVLKQLGVSDERINEILDPYKKTNVTDAQVIIHPEFFKLIHYSQGTWTPELETAYNIAEGIIPGDAKKSVQTLLRGFKPFYFGKRFDPVTETWYYEQVKCSMFPLFKSYTDINPLFALKREEMEKDNIDMIAFESSFKGAIGYRSDFLDDNKTILELDVNNFGIQQANPDHTTEGNDSLRQLKMILPGTIDTNVSYNGRSGADILDEILSLEAANLKTDLIKLTKLLNNPSSQAEFNSFIQEMITKRGAYEVLVNFLSVDENGQYIYPLDSGITSTKVQELLSSVFTSKVLKQKFNHGGSLVQATSLGLKFSNLSEQQKNLTPELLAKQRKLEWFKPNIQTGQIGYAECIMPASAKKFFDENGFLKDINNIPDALKEFIAYRIPTEGLHSTMAIRVIEFLPKELGNFILLPYHVTTQFGADFDFDKIYFFGREFTTSVNKKTGKVTYRIPEMNYDETEYATEQRYKDYVYSVLQDKNNELYYEDVITEYEKYYGEPIASLSKNEKIQVLVSENILMTLDKFSKRPIEEQNTKAARNNRIVDNYLNIITSIENLTNIIAPSSFKDIADFKNNYFGENEKVNFFADFTQNNYKNRNHTGRILKGIWALHLTGHSYARISGLSTKQNVNAQGFVDYGNSVNLEGGITEGNNHRNDFSRLYNDEGKLIARELGKVMAAVLDDLKNPLLESLNINQYTTHALAAILRAGYSMETMLLFSSQPAITKFSQQSIDNSSALSKKTERFDIENLKVSYIKILKDIYNKYEYQDNPDIKRLMDTLNTNIPITNAELKDILTNFTNDANGNLINKVTGKKPSVEQAMKYYHVQVNVLKQMENLIAIGDQFKNLNNFYTINKEVGPQIEDIIEQQDLLVQISKDDILRDYEIDSMATLYQTWDTHLNALDYFSKYFPYSSELYMGIKSQIALIQKNKSISGIKTDDRKLINNFIRTYLDYSFEKFVDIPSQSEELLRSFPSMVKQITKGTSGLKIDDISYEELSKNPFIANIEVKFNKKTGLNQIQLKSGQLIPQVKDSISNGLILLYNNKKTRGLAENFVKYAFLTSGFYTGVNMYSNLIDPSILKAMEYTNYRMQTTNDLVNGTFTLEVDNNRLIDQLVRNYPYNFTNIFDSNLFDESTKNGLPNKLTLNEEALNEANMSGYMFDTKIGILTPRYIMVRQKDAESTKKEGLTLYKLENNNEGFKYVKINELGKKGFLIEVNPLEDIVNSVVNRNLEKIPDAILQDPPDGVENDMMPELSMSKDTEYDMEASILGKSQVEFDAIDKAIAAKSITQPIVQPTERKTYSGKVTSLQPNQIFVFGSNPLGINGNPSKGTGGAALVAYNIAGVKQGEKMDNKLSDSGKAWGITTVKAPGQKRSKTPEQITEGIKKLYEYAKQNPTKEFLISDYSGTNLNGYTGQEMADMFVNAGSIPSNIVFNNNFDKLITTQPTTQPTAQDNQILNSPQFKEFYNKELESNPNLTVEEALDYYKKCK